MSEIVIFGVIFTVIFIFVALIAKLALFCRKFAEDTQKICRKMDRAESYKEYCSRRDELRCHYLTLIPFVNEKNVQHLHDRIFRRADRSELKERKDSLVPLLLPSVLGVCICTLCLCGMTWAWYSASIETPTQKMSAAYYWVKAEVEGVERVNEGTVAGGAGKTNDTETKSENISRYDLQANTSYTVVLTANGNGDKDRGGYCLIECGESKQYTQTINPGKTIKITLHTGEQGGLYTFTGVWGSIPSSVAKDKIIKADAENAKGNTTDETTAEPIDSSTPPVYETTAEVPVIPKPESTASQETTPAESDPAPVVPSDPIPSDTPVTEPAPDSETDSLAVTEEPTDFDTAPDPSASDGYVSEEEEKAIGGV